MTIRAKIKNLKTHSTLVDDNNGFGNAQGGEFDTTNDNNGFGNSQDGEFGGTSKRTGTAKLVGDAT